MVYSANLLEMSFLAKHSRTPTAVLKSTEQVGRKQSPSRCGELRAKSKCQQSRM